AARARNDRRLRQDGLDRRTCPQGIPSSRYGLLGGRLRRRAWPDADLADTARATAQGIVVVFPDRAARAWRERPVSGPDQTVLRHGCRRAAASTERAGTRQRIASGNRAACAVGSCVHGHWRAPLPALLLRYSGRAPRRKACADRLQPEILLGRCDCRAPDALPWNAMLDAPGNHIVPVGSRVEVCRRRPFSLAHGQNIVVVEEVAGLASEVRRA